MCHVEKDYKNLRLNFKTELEEQLRFHNSLDLKLDLRFLSFNQCGLHLIPELVP